MRAFLIIILVLFLISCSSEDPEGWLSFDTLPENLIATDGKNGIMAYYVNPVSYYQHGILGDAIEGGALLVDLNNNQIVYSLNRTQVFEDIVPRLVDVDMDDFPEIVSILTHVEKGASIAIFKIEKDTLILHAQSAYIGRSYRWLNIAALNDLDDDGRMEICWVSTPHIGGTLNVGWIEEGIIEIKDSQDGVSNHKIGSGNLDLSLISTRSLQKTMYIPNDNFSMLVGFHWKNDAIVPIDTIRMIIDPFVPLSEQNTSLN